ncbi:MAG: hypothetical protein IPM94_13990, partial [bacterium]|nr:hypothetical protein [bacterium]
VVCSPKPRLNLNLRLVNRWVKRRMAGAGFEPFSDTQLGVAWQIFRCSR